PGAARHPRGRHAARLRAPARLDLLRRDPGLRLLPRGRGPARAGRRGPVGLPDGDVGGVHGAHGPAADARGATLLSAPVGPMARRGYLTMAVGRPRYLEMAVDMVLSLRGHTDHPIALAADEPLAARARERYPRVFDEVTLVPQRFLDGRAIKYGSAAASPFEETTFVDSDCLVLGSLEYLWAGLDGSDVAMLGELLTERDNENHHGFMTRRLMRRFGLDRYLKTNSGVFCFRTGPARAVMDQCLDTYLNEVRPKLRGGVLRGGWVGDEIGFGVVGGRLRLGTLPLPHAMYWPQEFAALDL